MNKFEDIRDKKIFETLIIIKIIYVILCGLAMMMHKYIYVSEKYCIYIIILIGLYFIWLYNNQFNKINKKKNSKNYIEIALLIVITTLVILLTGKENSPYKFLYIFIIIISAIQLSIKYSMYISILSSSIICIIDMIPIYVKEKVYSKDLLVSYFQSDIVIIIAFLAISWILVRYVSIEKEHSKELQTLANVDELTGLYNHRYFQESLQNIINIVNVENRPVSLLFIDIDYFKNYNDTNGHQAGDFILSEIGSILKKLVRQGDIVARYGGEEFAVILPNTYEKCALEIAERIRRNIENTYFVGQESQPNKNVTISIGVSSYPMRSKTKYQLINTADDALYRAKSLNKNRVELYYNVLD